MYGIFTYIWAIFGTHVGKYSIHGSSGCNCYPDCCAAQETIHAVLLRGRCEAGSWTRVMAHMAHCFASPEAGRTGPGSRNDVLEMFVTNGMLDEN